MQTEQSKGRKGVLKTQCVCLDRVVPEIFMPLDVSGTNHILSHYPFPFFEIFFFKLVWVSSISSHWSSDLYIFNAFIIPP